MHERPAVPDRRVCVIRSASYVRQSVRRDPAVGALLAGRVYVMPTAWTPIGVGCLFRQGVSGVIWLAKL